MHIKEYITPIILSSVFVFGLQYFFGGFVQKNEKDAASFTLQERAISVEYPPLKTVSYDKNGKKRQEKQFVFEAQWGAVTLDSGNIVGLEYKKISKRDMRSSIMTLTHEDDVLKQTPSLLVAFEEKTPLVYSLARQEAFSDRTVVEYKGENEYAAITKKFTLHSNLYQIDLAISLVPKSKKPLNFVRVFFQSPYTVSEQGVGKAGAVIVDKNKEIIRTKDAITLETQGWKTPKIFGSENQYFTNVCFKDVHHDIMRAYYVTEEDRLVSVLEFSPIEEAKTVELSFYMGPKEIDALYAVDTAVADIFAYKGILAPLYKFLFAILKWLSDFFGNFGIAIILLTILVRVLLLPLAMYTERSQKEAKEFEKKMNYITQKYKNDDEQLQLARAELVKNQGFSLLQAMLFGIGTQIPLFVCLNYMFGNTVELFNAPFLWIPNLSGQDPFYILPFFVMGSMIVQSPVALDAKKRLNSLLFALVIGALATRFSAGLGLYFVVSALFGLLQTFFMKKIFVSLSK